MIPLVLFALVAASLAAKDPCNAASNCPDCLALNPGYCGWCSTKVVYNDSSPGAQCAGFSEDGTPNPFVCHGVYSTESCWTGFVCNEDSVCVPGAPGTGLPIEQCQAQCSQVGKTYLCDNATFTCHIAPAGTGTAYPECEAACQKPPPPVSPSAPSTVSPATPSSLSPASPSNIPPTAPVPVVTPPGTPSRLINNWRGLSIENGYITGEFDIVITEAKFTMYPPGGAAISGATSYPITAGNQLWVTLDAGTVLKFLWVDQPAGPNTEFISLGRGAPGSDAPSSIGAALSARGGQVFALAACLPGTPCRFAEPTLNHVIASTQRRKLMGHPAATANELPRAHPVRLNVGGRHGSKAKLALLNDPCVAATTCNECIATQPACGWCSTPVRYNDSSVGGQCAGPSGPTFKCNGTYSTERCPAQYYCDVVNQRCSEDPRGLFPSYKECQDACMPAPTFECNTTTWTCERTEPGKGTSQPICEAQCNSEFPASPSAPSETSPSAPQNLPPVNPVTPPALLGTWRGIRIDNGYAAGEFEFVFDDSSNVTVYFNGREMLQGRVGTSIGGWVVITVAKGNGAGTFITGSYGLSVGPVVDAITLALSGPNEGFPPTFVEAMNSAPKSEYVLWKCIDPACRFNVPTPPSLIARALAWARSLFA